ncbi:AbrB-like transcriptional regulator [Thermacetogenium phaeum DSM 12270]|jgi:AbrB family looped-hinge helix DNA binding protein|uniref:AbrB-like transcriptional regulator n=1 Tax=Thermacetogenium phaeum (strain ATCC BAA-254 / DSM 26808 / PB) TaxID=1089553 RepID=K4LEP1_THEPS|nr:AbrB/MazE/SpoVT family DNA-binding domain-containing protein [Thermacetogenium phaeum]AFV10445.1 AbrB-like transcriptional regulator [Thermacetogenium phaeum DSM 12270]
MNVSRVSPRGQVVIPKHLRDKFNIKPNSKVYFTESDGKLVLHILPPDPVAAARGILQKDIPLDELIRQNREEELSYEKEFQNR